MNVREEISNVFIETRICAHEAFIIFHYTTRAIFFQGPIGREIKTTVKIKNVLFATFSYTYQLLLYIVAAPT